MTKGKVTIVGCGLIGSCWGALFASSGYSVSVFEVNDEAVQRGINNIRGNLDKMQKEGLLRGELSPIEAMENVNGTNDLKEALEDSIYAQESTLETEEFKTEIFSRMASNSSSNTILASSTSTIPASKFTENNPQRSRCLVVHPVNPPLYLKLTEVVPSEWTDKEIVDRTVEIMRDIGQAPIRLHKEVLGFAVNRIQYALLAESWRLVKDEVMDPEDVDLVMSEGLGPRYAFYGPLQVIHMNANGVADYCNRYASGIQRVLADMGPPPTFTEQEVIEKISSSLSSSIPDLPTALIGREKNLAKLAKLKKE